MKSTKSTVKSFKNVISKTRANKELAPNQNFGETVIPIGSDDLFIKLPNLSKTYTYNIINTAEMTGDITLKTSSGASLRGLVLNTDNGSLSINPIQIGTDEITLEGDVKDGCYIQTLSNGNQWFIWSIATGGTINVRAGGTITTYTPTPTGPTYADITNVVITSDVRFVGSALEARHDLTFSGEGEPGASLTITEDGGAITPIDITIPSTGRWTVTRATDLPNATYTFDFNTSRGNGVQNRSFFRDTGPITFTVPSAFSPDPAEVVNFASGASAAKPDGTQITVAVDSNAWTENLVHGDTFDIIYSITDPAVNGGVTVSQTVTGTIVDDTPPAAPVFLAASITNINELSANGTAEPGKTITLFRDNQPLSPTVVSDSVTGQWSIGPIVLAFNGIFTLKAQASEAGVGNPNLSDFGEYSPAFNHVQPVTDTPTIGVDGEQTSVWTNTSNSLTILGTTEIGATIEVFDGANPATLVSGPTVAVDGQWSATIAVADESVTSLSVKATLPNHHQSQAASFQLNVDRVPPEITLADGTQTVYLGNIDSSNDAGFSVSDARSGVATQTSNWDAQVLSAEGSYTVTYNATDNAGNSANAARTVNVSTQVVVPTNIEATASSLEAVVIGDVTGTYADNLSVKIYVTDSNGLEEVYQENNVDVEFQVTNGTFSATLTLSAGEYTFEASTVNSVDEESTQSSATGGVTVTGAGGGTSEVGIASIIDEVYNDPSSTIVGSPTLTNSILEITEDEYIINGDIAEYMYQDYLSISFWIKSTENTQDAVNKFVSLGWAHSGNQKFAHVIGNQTSSPYNGFRVITPSGGVIDEAVPSGDWNDEQWHMLTLTWDNIDGEKKFYYDGQQLGSTVTFNSKSDPFRDGDDVYGLIIGTGTGTAGGIRAGEAFRGKMTNMVINNFIWTDQEVSDLYNAGFDNQITIERTDLFLEDLSGLAIVGNATVSSGIFSRNNGHGGQHGATFNLETEGVVDFNSDGTRVDEELTVSFWFRPDQTWANNWRYVGGNAQDSNNEFRLATSLLGNGNLEFRCIFFNNQQKFGSSTSALNVGEWYHLAVTYSQNASNPSNHDLKMFVNGEKVSETLNLSNNLLKKITDRTFGIGGYSSGGNISGNTLDHSSDSWQIASGTALAESQVVAIYNQTDRQMTIAEAAALPVFIEQSATLFDNASIANCTLHLDGNGDYATVSDGFRYTDSISISLWFKTSDSTSRIISSHIAGAGNNGFFIGLNNGKLQYRTPNQTNVQTDGPNGLNNGQWHHIVVTWTLGSPNRKLYVDNSLYHQQNAGNTAATGYVAGQPLYIGAINNVNSGPYDFFDGEISRVEVLNQVLSPTEVTTRYNAGNGAC